MTVSDIREECARLGIQLSTTDRGALKVKALKGSVSPALLAGLKAHKDELLQELQDQAREAWDATEPPLGQPGDENRERLQPTDDASIGGPPGQGTTAATIEARANEGLEQFGWLFEIGPDDLPDVPFPLHHAVTVIDKERFLNSLRKDLAQGPRGPRARSGALQSDCARLATLLRDHRQYGRSTGA